MPKIPSFVDFSDALLKFIKENERSFIDDNLTRLYDELRLDENGPLQIADSLERRVKEVRLAFIPCRVSFF